MPMPPPFPPKAEGAAPPFPPDEGMGAAAEAKAGTEKILGAATEAGVTKPLDDLAKEEGLDLTGAELLKYAQDIPELHGKSVEEIAEALRSDMDLLDEVVAKKSGEATEPGEDFNAVKDRMMKDMPEDNDGEEF